MQQPSKQFEAIFLRHHKSLCDVAFTFVKDKDAAKDIVQEVFLKLWKNIGHVELSEQIGSYLFKATTHTALNHLRGGEKTIRIEQHPAIDKHVMTLSTGSPSEFSELENLVDKAIERLPPRCRVIYLLSRHEGLKYSQIAETLGLSIKTVENQMSIALERMRAELLPYLGSRAPIVVLGIFLPISDYFH